MLVKGKSFWAFTNTPDVKFEPVYRISVQMDDEEAKKLKAVGLKVRRNDEGVFEYKFKRGVTNKKTGEPNPKPKVVDANREPLDAIIGNGSDVVVQYKVYEWKNSFGKGTSADFQAVQVLNLIPYGDGTGSAPDGEEFEKLENPAKKEESLVEDEY